MEDNAQKTSDIVYNIIPQLKSAYDDQVAKLAKGNKLKELHDQKLNLLFFGV